METQKATATHLPSPSPSASGGRAVQPASRWYYLDWLRVLAILTVFLFHITKIFNYDYFVTTQVRRGLAKRHQTE